MEVTLIDSMGTDLTVVNAARVSFDKESDWMEDVCDCDPDGENESSLCRCTQILSEQDQKLIKYLAKHNHFTPFTHVQITMREKVPIFVARQRFKHMVGFTYNEVSRRYVDSEPEFFKPDVWRKKAENKKQGSSDETINPKAFWWGGNPADIINDYIGNSSLDQRGKDFLFEAASLYEARLKAGIAPEQARMDLPQSLYTEFYVTGSLAAWARAYKLRIDPHAQKEIQDLAKMWNDTISDLPELKYSWEALSV